MASSVLVLLIAEKKNKRKNIKNKIEFEYIFSSLFVSEHKSTCSFFDSARLKMGGTSRPGPGQATIFFLLIIICWLGWDFVKIDQKIIVARSGQFVGNVEPSERTWNRKLKKKQKKGRKSI